MARLARLVLLVAVCVGLLAPRAFAWGPEEHRAIAAIAAKELTPAASAEVERLLGEKSMCEVSNWADTIGDERPETKPLHYLNVPPGTDRIDREIHKPEAGSVLSALDQSAALLGQPALPDKHRALALRWTIHLVGDIHAPLHVSHAEDRGGNEIMVTLSGEEMNLHRAWDSALTPEHPREYQGVADVLHARATRGQRHDWATLNFETWATESYLYSVQVVYRVPESGVLDEDYVEQAEEITSRRMTQAGLRLGWLLNTLLDPEVAAKQREAAEEAASRPATKAATQPED